MGERKSDGGLSNQLSAQPLIAGDNYQAMSSSEEKEPSLKKIRDAISDVEVPTSPVWRTAMIQRRCELGLSQVALGRKVGVHQTTISEIETGRVQQSIYIPAIALALRMDMPHVLIKDELEARWISAGRRVREQDPRVYEWVLRLLETDRESK